MALKILVVLSVLQLFFGSLCLALEDIEQRVARNFKIKNYSHVAGIYLKNSQDKFQYKNPDTIRKIAISMVKIKQYRAGAQLHLRYIKMKFGKDHERILKAIESKKAIAPEEVNTELQKAYFSNYVARGLSIKTYKNAGPRLDKEVQKFDEVYKILSELEYKVALTDKIQQSVRSYVSYLSAKVYHKKFRLKFLYLNWQQDATLTTSLRKIPLIVNNSGFCIGGEYGIQNKFYHFFSDGCLFFGGGTVSARSGQTIYKQGGVGVQGLKIAPGAGKFVSSSMAEVGFKLPVMFLNQKLQEPPTSFSECSSGCSTGKSSSVFVLTSLYTRFPIGKWGFTTEFSRFIGQDNSLWALGVTLDY